MSRLVQIHSRGVITTDEIQAGFNRHDFDQDGQVVALELKPPHSILL